MDHHDRRLSVCKSSSKISKPSSAAPRPPSASSSRPPATVVSADLTNFRRVVQQLTGTPPPSAASSPVHESTRSSRLQRIAPPPLRPLLHLQYRQHQQPLHQYEQQHDQQVSNLPALQQPHHDYMRHDIHEQDKPQHDFSWLSSVGLFSPPLPYTQLLSPHHVSALLAPTASDSMWANLLHATPSPRPLSISAGSLPPLLPLPYVSGEDLGHSRSEAFKWRASSVPSSNELSTHGHSVASSTGLPSSSNGSPLLPSSLNGHPLLPSSSNGRLLLGFSSNGNPVHSSSSSNEQSLLGPSPKGRALLPSPLPPLLPLSPSSAFFNPWCSPRPSSPLLPLGFGLPLSPGLGPFITSPGGLSFCGTKDYQSKLP